MIRFEKESSAYRKEKQLRISSSPLYQYLFSAVSIFLITLVNYFIEPSIGYRATGFIFLFGILLQGLFFRVGPLIFSSILSAVIWSYYFLPPSDSFAITSYEDAVLLLFYILITFVIVIWASRIRIQKRSAFKA